MRRISRTFELLPVFSGRTTSFRQFGYIVLCYVNSVSGKPMISCNWRHVVMHAEMVER
jgi:hypothetical protein